ncbi:MAG: hypothetical protein NC251_12215 [Lachnoclostridium sp.]|nr:hypothetical protein [Lachnospira sp.]MCM1249178.1 hypothetical protein [Lachnoclostridium sp.]
MIYRVLFCLAAGCIIFLPVLMAWMWKQKKLSKCRFKLEGMVLAADASGEVYIKFPYVMRFSPFYFILGMIGAVFFYGLTVMMALLASDMAVVVFVAFFCFWPQFLCIVTMLWEIRVEEDKLTIYRFPLRPKEIFFYEITKVRYIDRLTRSGGARMQLIAYHNEKKLFDVDEGMSHFDYLVRHFEAEIGLEKGFLKEGGLELNAYQEEFSITETKADKVRAFVCELIGIGLLITGIFAWEEFRQDPYYPIYYAVMMLFFVMWTWDFICVMMRKVTVTYQDISVRNAWGRVKKYSMREITRVEDNDSFILLYANDTKIAKIWKSHKNFALLAHRLEGRKWEV